MMNIYNREYKQGDQTLYYSGPEEDMPKPASTPALTPAPTAPTDTPSPYYPRYTEPTTLDNPTPQSVEEIQAAKSKAAQAEIDALNSYYAGLSQEQGVINAKNDRSTAAISTLTGLAGSTEADVQQQTTTAKGQEANKKIQNEKAVAIQGILSKIRSDAVAEARQQRLDYNSGITDSINNRAKTAEMQANTIKTATENIKNLSASGVTLDGLKTNDSQSYDYLLKLYGSENALKGAFVLNTPQDQIIDKKIVGSSYIISRQNPITGKITIEHMDIPGLPPDYSASADLGNRIMFYDPSDPQNKQFFVSKGLTPTQQQANNGAGDGSGTPGSTTAAPDAQQRLKEALTLAQELRSDKTAGKSGAVGFGFQKFVPFGEGLGLQPNRAGFEAKLNTLKANLTLDNLKLLKGAMSDKDLLFLNSVGSSLDPNMSEKAFNTELDRVVAKLQSATGDISSQVTAKGYDYTAMKADGLTDDEIRVAVGI